MTEEVNIVFGSHNADSWACTTRWSLFFGFDIHFQTDFALTNQLKLQSLNKSNIVLSLRNVEEADMQNTVDYFLEKLYELESISTITSSYKNHS